jgi:hypothetical protein
LLHQLPFRAHRVERLQQQRSQQPLRPVRRSAFARLSRSNDREQLSQRRVDEFADRAQRMIRRNTSLQTHVAEKAFRLLIFTAHRFPQPKGIGHMHGITPQSPRKTTFSAAWPSAKTGLCEPDLHVFAKLFEDRLERGLEGLSSETKCYTADLISAG